MTNNLENKVFPGTSVFRQLGGLSGTAEVRIYHDGTNGFIKAGTGEIVVGPIKFPGTDGATGQAIITDGSGNLSFTTLGTGSVSQINTGTGLIGGPITNAGTISMAPTGVTPGTYGNGTIFPQITIDGLGRILAVGTIQLGNMAAQNAGAVNIVGGTITGMSSPVNPLDVANKSYVDAIASSLNIHASCNAATISNLSAIYSPGTTGADSGSGVGATLTNASTQAAFSVDSYTASLNDRILVKDQTTQLQNGIYTVTTLGDGSTNWVLTRASDYDNHAIATDVDAGDFTFVINGSTNANTGWVESSGSTPIVIGTTSIVFTQFSGAGEITAGTGLSKSGNTLFISNTGVTSGTYGGTANVPQITVNAQGQITAVSNVSVAYPAGTSVTVSAGSNISVGTNTVGTSTTYTINGSGGTGSVTNITTGSGLTGGPITNTGTISIAATGVIAGTYNQVVVNTLGQVTGGTIAATGTGSVTQIVAGAQLTGGTITNTGTISLATSGVTAGTYGDAANTNTIVVNAYGQITSISTNAINYGTGSVTNVSTGTDLTGGPITSSGTLNLATQVGVTAGTYGNAANIPQLTVNSKGIITAIGTVAISIPNNVVVSAGSNVTVGTTLASGTTTYTVNGSSGTVTSVSAGTGLSGGPITSAGTISMSTSGVTAGTYTNANITVDALGRVTQATSGSAGTSLTGITSASNTALGSSAGTLLSTGIDNVLLGNQAGRGITTGSYNVAVGFNSMGATLSGSTTTSNVAVGYFTASGLTSGSNNVAIGYAAGQSISSGVGVTAVGYQALTNNSSATNTAVGNQAGKNITTGSQNTIVGAGALPGPIAGGTFNANTAIGDSALSGISSGAGNVAIGAGAGTGVTTGSGNIYIGTNISGSAGDTNQLNIGGAFTGTMSTTTGLAVTSAMQGVPVTLTSAATVTINFGSGNNFSLTLGTNVTLANPATMPAGQSGNIAITQAASGGPYTISFGSNWKSINGTAGTMSITAGAQNIISYYISDSSHIWYSMQNGGVI